MIFVTVGHELGFDRLIKAIDQWAGLHPEQEVFAQVAELTPQSYRPENIPFSEFVSPDQFADYFARATLIVSHAGMGTIITALTSGKPILLMPRRGHLRETRNDHQVATVRKFSSKTGIHVADDESRFDEALTNALSQSEAFLAQPASPFAEDQLISTIRDFIHQP
jgi:exopolysaccharide biosynthesis glucuronosyltransferase PssE